jgi:cell division septation protein DedD
VSGGRRNERPPGRSRAPILGLVLLATFAVPPAAAQQLERVDSLARAGDMEPARTLLLDWFDRAGEDAAREEVQRAIWLRGVLTLDPAQAAMDFTRLALEYPGGPYSDRALLRLARAARARGEVAVAARHYRRLARDYPGSPARMEARSWLGDHAATIAEVEAARRATPRAGRREPGVAREAEIRRERAQVVDGPSATEGAFTVQIGAFADVAGARDLRTRLAEAGIAARLVTVGNDDLVRVRAGRFSDAGGATRLHDRVLAAGFDAMVVADARREEPFR